MNKNELVNCIPLRKAELVQHAASHYFATAMEFARVDTPRWLVDKYVVVLVSLS